MYVLCTLKPNYFHQLSSLLVTRILTNLHSLYTGRRNPASHYGPSVPLPVLHGAEAQHDPDQGPPRRIRIRPSTLQAIRQVPTNVWWKSTVKRQLVAYVNLSFTESPGFPCLSLKIPTLKKLPEMQEFEMDENLILLFYIDISMGIWSWTRTTGMEPTPWCTWRPWHTRPTSCCRSSTRRAPSSTSPQCRPRTGPIRPTALLEVTIEAGPASRAGEVAHC